jgi:SsrA-binding protein
MAPDKNKDRDEIRVVANNRRASFDYELGETYEAGIALTGGEIKSIRAGRMDLRDGFVQIRSGEAFLINAYIPTYALSTGFARAEAELGERRERKLLLHKKEIRELRVGVDQKGFTAIATRVLLKKGRAKVVVALARGKKQHDKRQTIAKRDAKRDIERAMRD